VVEPRFCLGDQAIAPIYAGRAIGSVQMQPSRKSALGAAEFA
jgi:hypothetical protein